MPSLLQLLFPIFDLIFDFWPILLLAPLQNRKSGIRNMVYVWAFWAVIRIILFFNPEPIKASFLIPEPLSTILFFVAGFVLIVIWLGVKYWKSGQMRSKALGMSTKDLLDLPPGEFEEMAAELYRAFGYRAHKTGMSGDHGVDVVVKAKDGKKMIVQCKRWRKPVGEAIVRDFYGAMNHEKAAHGTIIATSGFTQQAVEWAKGKPLSLQNGSEFLKLWERAEKKRLASQKGG